MIRANVDILDKETGAVIALSSTVLRYDTVEQRYWRNGGYKKYRTTIHLSEPYEILDCNGARVELASEFKFMKVTLQKPISRKIEYIVDAQINAEGQLELFFEDKWNDPE